MKLINNVITLGLIALVVSYFAGTIHATIAIGFILIAMEIEGLRRDK